MLQFSIIANLKTIKMKQTVNPTTKILNQNHKGIIYMATNTITGKVYVGQSTQPFSQRQNDHFSDSNKPHTKKSFS